MFAAILNSELAEWDTKARTVLNETVAVGSFSDKDLDMRLVEADEDKVSSLACGCG